MSILIIGSEGSMGKRYQAILRFLGKDFKCVDQLHAPSYVDTLANKSTGVIIATPTKTHLEIIRRLAQSARPILCEKPLVKTEEELSDLMAEVKSNKIQLRMMMQYQMIASPANGETSYDYFRHGSDGLIWDCMQIISLARGKITLAESSPIWKCTINGKELSLSQMDMAYIEYLKLWFEKPAQDVSYLQQIHQKTIDYKQRVDSGRVH